MDTLIMTIIAAIILGLAVILTVTIIWFKNTVIVRIFTNLTAAAASFLGGYLLIQKLNYSTIIESLIVCSFTVFGVLVLRPMLKFALQLSVGGVPISRSERTTVTTVDLKKNALVEMALMESAKTRLDTFLPLLENENEQETQDKTEWEFADVPCENCGSINEHFEKHCRSCGVKLEGAK